MKPRILGYGLTAGGVFLPIAVQANGTPGGVELLGELTIGLPMYLLYGLTSGGDVLPVLVDADGAMNISW